MQTLKQNCMKLISKFFCSLVLFFSLAPAFAQQNHIINGTVTGPNNMP